MGVKLALLAASLVVLAACGKTSSNDGTTAPAADSEGAGGSGTTGTAGGQGGASVTTTFTVTTGGPVCAFPDERDCGGECVNLRTSPEHCGSCGNVCPDDQACILSRCASPIDCERSPAQYGAADMEPSGGVALDDGWLLPFGQTLSLEHTFADARGVLLLTARGVDGEPRPHVSVTIGEQSLGPLLLRATSHATYSLEFDGMGANGLVSITPATIEGSEGAGVVIQSLEILNCWSMHGQCEGGGYYLSEIPACAPAVCSEPEDCTRDVPGPPFLGSCNDGTCAFPSCTEPAASGRPLYEEVAAPDAHIQCYSYADLTDPLHNPRATSVAGDPQNFECPAIDTLTWQVDPFEGESGCIEGPICGPNKPEELNLPASNECCYMVASMCGV